ncbi:MAG TPA: DNA polymerase Y family protein [Polyangiaceae bacterium]|nr:DNA polymerase Y family protein [Polyangiaceae bacterium]
MLTDTRSCTARGPVEQKTELESKTELDAVNATAHRLGIRPRQTIAQACAIVENLVVHALPRARLLSALKQIAEVALGFGAPVSFQAPDTVWVDISGSGHLYPSERELALELAAQIRALGHAPRVAVADGPWLAQSFARHAQLEPPGILLVDTESTDHAVSQLPIIALPIHREAVSWFSRLGLLSIQDLRALPLSALAARLEDRVLDVPLKTILDLIQGRDTGVLVPHQPEEVPCEELFWEDPLENVEPLLFVLKGLSGRLSARLEGRGQAAQELRLTIHYDRSIAAHAIAAHAITASSNAASSNAASSNAASSNAASSNAASSIAVPAHVGGSLASHSSVRAKSLSFKLASPLFHAEDLERVLRPRLQKQTLIAPTLGLSLQATSVTEARCCQLGLGKSGKWSGNACEMAPDPRTLAVLVAELTADIGAESVGVLALLDSHLPEKSSTLLPFGSAQVSASSPPAAARWQESAALLELPRVPTRLFEPPIEVHAPIRKSELWVIHERAFIVSRIQFEQRLEGVEWWARNKIFRDYFRVWLAEVPSSRLPYSQRQPWRARAHEAQPGSSGLEALVYRDRLYRDHEQSTLLGQLPGVTGKSYVQGLYD